MEYRKLGKSDLEISRICMGCMGFGESSRGQHTWTLGEEESRKIIRQGLEAGINFFDTAMGYSLGTSEQYLGKALWDYAKRDEVVVATKFIPRSDQEIESGISGQAHIEHLLNQSLTNLGMDYVDLYIYHMWDYRTPLYDIMDGLSRIVKAGKVRYIGISNCYAWQLAKANELAEQRDISMTEISLAWLIQKVTAPVVGMTRPGQVEQAVKATELRLTGEEIEYLEELYVPHRLVGVMAQDTQVLANTSHVWSVENKK